jgi:hypothetical protein
VMGKVKLEGGFTPPADDPSLSEDQIGLLSENAPLPVMDAD